MAFCSLLWGVQPILSDQVDHTDEMTRQVDLYLQSHDLASPEDLVVMGFSNGGGMATYVAGNRPVARAVLCSGALPLDVIGQDHWPQGVPAQLHYALDDPFLQAGSVESVLRSVGEAGAIGEYLQYPGAGHLFTDPSLPAEFDGAATEAFWGAVLRFIGGGNSAVSH